ncbi:MAG: protein kinase [Rubripirellula sp.]
MTTTHEKRIRAGYEPIAGYVLEEVIGRGGFGEVWRASAPGGLKKAVKFVFGAHDQSRAARELRSLERLRGVQHPFLLTLERFEAIEDQLVIVTELADCSLEDVQKNHRDTGSCGIPRDVLLPYLHDAADALDYLHEKYQLQHLDIKPGNLLLVGGHVKVADFGLLKDLREADVSVVGGLTPIYAPPELFDGRPNMNSDQYSLAVMYQELLTGTRPFGGRTIAQLATQHVHSAPNLEPLPPADRPAVARALEKNPERRFPNCKAFVAELNGSRKQVRGAELPSSPDEYTVTAEPVEDLPQLEASGQNASGQVAKQSNATRHAIVIAIGGTGAECLRELRRRATDSATGSQLDLHSVLIDTDMSTIHSMRVGELSDRVPPCHSIYTPLRTAQEYRQNGTERLGTISRRWIYNVPRSGSTEGMRPLGRLALVDHGKTVAKRLAESIADVLDNAAGSLPSIYVVGSLTGGTCSGMYIDAVHLLRHVLDEAGLEEAEIHSLLSISAMQANPANPLALHDTQAALIEMNHFLNAGNGYPGDAGAGWPSVPAARTPLKNVYLIAGATQCSIAPSQVETITDYVWADATGAKDLLSSARAVKLTNESSIVVPSVRSVGVVPLSDGQRLEQKLLAPAVVRDLLVRWLGLPSKARHAASILCDRIMRRCGITTESISEDIRAGLTQGVLDQLLNDAVPELTVEQRTDRHAVCKVLMPKIESMINEGVLQTSLARIMKSLHRELSVCLHDRKADVTTIIECLKLLEERSNDIVVSLRANSCATTPEDGESFERIVSDLIAACQLEQLRDNLKLLEERYDRFAMTLAMAISLANHNQNPGANPWGQLPEQVRTQFQFVVVQLHEATVNRYLVRPMSNPGSGLEPNSIVHDLTDATIPLVEELYSDAVAVSTATPSESIGTTDLTTTSLPTSESKTLTAVTDQLGSVRKSRERDEPLSVEEAVVAVKPTLLMFGGLQRMILVVGSEREKAKYEAQVRNNHDGSVTVALVPGSSPKLVHEAQQIELKGILERLNVLNGSNAQITRRLSSRTDVSW